MKHPLHHTLAVGISTLGLIAGAAQADQVIADDLIVQNSICVGLDCVNGESFGFDTLRLKENNLRIHFQDTSNSASFPSRDWRIVANDSGNGGANYLAFEDSDAGTYPFRVLAGAGNNALYVDAQGDVGLGTSNPVVELHVSSGDSPTLRLEQNNSAGFTAQTWDVAGNETNFFVRDATNGSQLPFKIRPSAPTNSIYVDTDGKIGLGTSSPSAALDLAVAGGLEINNGNIFAQQDGAVNLTLSDTTSGPSYPDFKIQYESGSARFSYAGTGFPELELKQNGNVSLGGTCMLFDRGGSSFACTFAAGAAPVCGAAGSTCP